MSVEKTLSIIKPDAISNGYTEEICTRIENLGLLISSKKQLHLTKEEAEVFYLEHKDKPFFNSLIQFITSGPVQVQVLEGEDAISRYRELMGDTNPQKADSGTLRSEFAKSIDANAVHGSDSTKSAEREIEFFFPNE